MRALGFTVKKAEVRKMIADMYVHDGLPLSYHALRVVVAPVTTPPPSGAQ